MSEGHFKFRMALVALICLFTVIGFIKRDTRKNETVMLYNINSTITETDGHFFLGFGGMEGKQYYVAYRQEEDGGFSLYKMEAEKTTIYQTLKEDECAYAEVTKDGFGEFVEIKLYVPENTIVSEYKLTE